MDERELEFKFNKAVELEQEGKYLHAIQLYSSLLNTEHYRRDSVMQLHKIYEKMGNIPYSSTTLKRHLESFPDDFEMRKYYSLFLIKHALYEDAVDQLSHLGTDEIPEVKFLTGLARFYMKDYEPAVINFTDFIAGNNPSDYVYDAYLYSAKANLELERIDKAMEAARGAEKIFANNEELQLLLTKIYLLKGLNLHAFESVSKGLRLNNESRQMNELAGRISFELGEYEKAENHLKKILSEPEQNDEIYTLLGLIYMKKGEYASAVEMLERAIELNPGNIHAAENKKICFEQLDNKNISQ